MYVNPTSHIGSSGEEIIKSVIIKYAPVNKNNLALYSLLSVFVCLGSAYLCFK